MENLLKFVGAICALPMFIFPWLVLFKIENMSLEQFISALILLCISASIYSYLENKKWEKSIE